MIEKLLLLIAQRGPGMVSLEPSDTSSPSSQADGTQLRFPASPLANGAANCHEPSTSQLAIWHMAKDEHYRGGSPQERAAALPPAYCGYSMTHALIGSLIWSERHYIEKNIVHITSRSGEVVAAVYPKERTVAVRKNAAESGVGTLSLKQLPSSARPFEGDQAMQFETVTVHMLLWYFGQVVPDAVESFPQELVKARLLLRKLPLVAPNALHMRHLRLIHLFSAGPIRLSALLSLAQADARPSICADLTSLFLTGCLASSEPTVKPK